jgi:hypothetical protein
MRRLHARLVLSLSVMFVIAAMAFVREGQKWL